MAVVDFELRGAGKIPAEHEAIAEAADKSAKEQEKLGQTWKTAASEVQKYDRLARDILKRNESDQEKYNRKLRDAKIALAGNARETEILARETTRLRVELLKAQDANPKLAAQRKREADAAIAEARRVAMEEKLLADQTTADQKRQTDARIANIIRQERAWGKSQSTLRSELEKLPDLVDPVTAAMGEWTTEGEALVRVQKRAFDPSKIKAWGEALTAAALPVMALVAKAFREIAMEREKLAGDSKQAIGGEGELFQFGATTEQKLAYIAEARGAYALGVGGSRSEAAHSLAGMLGAGIDEREDRLFLMRMQAAGQTDNAGELAKAAKTLQSNYGGELLSYVDRAYGAGDIAPGGASQLLLASAKVALTAGRLGLVPDEVVGGTAALAQATGSEDEGATLLDSYLGALDKAGGFKGMTLHEMTQEVKRRAAAGEDIRGDTLLGGRKEALKAFEFLAGQEGGATYKRALIGSYQGEKNRAGRKILEDAETADPNLRAARQAIIEERKRELQNLDEGTYINVIKSVREEQKAEADRLPWGVRHVVRGGYTAAEMFDSWNSPEVLARDLTRQHPWSGTGNTPAAQEGRKILESMDRQREIQEMQLRVLEDMNNKSNEGGLLIGGD